MSFTLIANEKIYFDQDSLVYRYRKSNRKLSEYELKKIAIKQTIQFRLDTQQLTKDLFAGTISFRSWQAQTIEQIKDAHVLMYHLGVGGQDNTKLPDYLDIANELRLTQYRYFKQFVRDIANGKLSQKKIEARLNLYWKGAKISFELGQKKLNQIRGNIWGARILGSCAPHCDPCISYQAAGILPINQLIMPGQACTCRSNCCCSIIYGKSRSEVEKKLTKR